MKVTPMTSDFQHAVLPRAVNPGDTIGIVAPAGPFDKKKFDRGIALIHEMGFSTKMDEGIYARRGYLAGDDHQRATLFNAMVADDEVRAIMCARGGYGVLRILDRLDYSAISDCPKPLVGFSDITALHQAFHLRTGLITFHGPMVTTIGGSHPATQRSWRETMMGACDLSRLLSEVRILKAGRADGVLAGGNLTTLCHLVGTPYEADYSGAILMIEDVGEAPYRIDRMLTQMKMAGVMGGISGLILGTFENCGPAGEIDALVMDRFQDEDIPIISGIPVGHGKDNLTVPLGVKVHLNTKGPEINILEPVFRKHESC